MNLPIQVQTALHQGQELAAKVSCSRSLWHAWVCVCPRMKSGRSYAEVLGEWTRTRLASSYDDTIACYEVRYIEISDWHLADEWASDLDLAIEQRPIVDEFFEAEDDTALIRILSMWLCDLSQLKHPLMVHYPHPPLMSKS